METPKRALPGFYEPSRCFLGIDPGASGALAFIDPDCAEPSGALLEVRDLPYYKVRTKPGKGGRNRSVLDVAGLVAILTDPPYRLSHIFYEEQIAGPGQSPVALATTFRNLGALEATFAHLGIAHTPVLPAQWKASLLRGFPKGDKGASVHRVLKFFPKAPVRGPRGGLLHDRAEAILIALYGRKVMANMSF